MSRARKKSPFIKIQRPTRPRLAGALLVWYGLSWSWLLVTDTTLLSSNDVVAKIIATLVFLILTGLSTFATYFTWQLIRRRANSLNPGLLVTVAVLSFTVMDLLISWGIAVIWIGPQGSLDSILPLGSVTLAAVNTPLVYASRLVGFHGLAGLTWTGLFLLALPNKRKHALLYGLALSLLSAGCWLAYAQPSGQKVRVVATAETFVNQAGPISAADADLIVFPEYGFDGIHNGNLFRRITPATNHTAHFVSSMLTGKRNTLVFGNSNQGITEAVDKTRLIPGGEDLAYVGRFGLTVTGQSSIIDYFSSNREVIKGSQPLTPHRFTDQLIVGSGVCSSIISPYDYRRFTSEGATLLTNSASLEIFNGSRVFAWQQQALARFMAVAHSRYFIQSANHGPAYVLDNNGRALALAEPTGQVKVTAVTNITKTLYTLLGEWLAWCGGILAAFLLIRRLTVHE